MAPYVTTMDAFAGRFATTPERVEILRGLLLYRGELLRLGLTQGFQWIDGSFVEDVEGSRGVPPQDVDVVTFFHRPRNVDLNALIQLPVRHPQIFNNADARAQYRVDAYFQPLESNPAFLVKSTRYWFGLFSHTRTGVWKGMLEIPLLSDDYLAARRL